jgi:excisionase family DNA binding protein
MNLQKEFEDLKKGQKELFELILNNGTVKSQPPLKWLDLNGLSKYLPSKPAHATIYGWLASGSIPAHKQGNRWIFSVSEIDDWIKSKKKKTLAEIEAETNQYLSKKNKGLK